MQIAVVEDNELIQSVLLAALEVIEGCRVTGFADAGSVLAVCATQVFDLMLFDHRLPDRTGTEAIRELRRDPRYAHVPLVMVTGDEDLDTRLAAIRAGATEFLTKPINVEELRLRVGNLLALRRAQRDAAEREKLLDAVIEASSASIAIADAMRPEAPLIYVNAAFERLSGYARGEVLERNCRFLNVEPPGSELRVALRRAVDGRLAARFRLRNRRSNGEVFWNQLDLQPVPGPGAAARYIVATQIDITAEVEARNSRARVDARLADIARLSAAWFFELDRALRLVYVSPAMAEALGAAPEQLHGLGLEALGLEPAPEHAGPAAPLQDLLAARRPVLGMMLRLPARPGPDDGPPQDEQDAAAPARWMQTSAIPVFSEGAAFDGYRGFAIDVSEIVAARDAAQQAERAKSTFIATMGHELRTPLTAIMGLAELLERVEDPGERSAGLHTIRAAAGDLAAVLGNVLDHAQIEGGRLTLAQAPFCATALCESVLGLHEGAARAKGLALRLTVQGPGAPQRTGDAARLRQVLGNLVANAVKFTDSGGVALRLILPDRSALAIEVEDSGTGIAPADRERIFAPFVQLDDGEARRHEGSGLGLSIAHKLVVAMGGTIAVRAAPTGGSIFRVALPLPAAEAPACPARPAELRLDGRRFLVADDNRANRKVLSLMLERLGGAATLCEDGSAALAAWQEGRFDALLLDINMPGLSGTEVIREVRRREAAAGLARIPAHAVTANARPEQVGAYLAAGFDGCIAKPLSLQTLSAALAGLDRTGGTDAPAALPAGPPAAGAACDRIPQRIRTS